MPLVTITLSKGTTEHYRQLLGAGIHRALVEVIGIPLDDRFQKVVEVDQSNLMYDREFLGIHRSDRLVVIEITLRRGRGRSERVLLHRKIVEILEERPGVRREDVLIVLTENDYADWSVGNGDAPLMRLLPAEAQ